MRRAVVLALQVLACALYALSVPQSTTASLAAVAVAVLALQAASWLWHAREERRSLREMRPIPLGRVPLRDQPEDAGSGPRRVEPKSGA